MVELKTRISHVVDILGNVIGRDQPIMLMDKAIQLVSMLDNDVFESDQYILRVGRDSDEKDRLLFIFNSI